MKIKLLIVFLFLFPFLVNYSTTSSYACSCIQPGSPSEELERSDFVFSGKVINISDPNKYASIQSSADLLEIHLEVSNTWKGVNETQSLVYTERDSASCGFNFSINDEYLVYGNEVDGKKNVNLCSKTTLLNNASEDLTVLGEGKQPSTVVNLGVSTDGEETQTDTEMSMNGPITIFAVTVLIIIIVSYMLVKKNTR